MDHNPATPCELCSAGTYADGGEARCECCQAGTFDHDADATTACMDCGVGRYSGLCATVETLPNGSDSSDNSLFAAVALFGSRRVCDECPAGRADIDRDPSTPCQSCPGGSWSPGGVRTTCISCVVSEGGRAPCACFSLLNSLRSLCAAGGHCGYGLSARAGLSTRLSHTLRGLPSRPLLALCGHGVHSLRRGSPRPRQQRLHTLHQLPGGYLLDQSTNDLPVLPCGGGRRRPRPLDRVRALPPGLLHGGGEHAVRSLCGG